MGCEVTPESIYTKRRQFMGQAGALALAAASPVSMALETHDGRSRSTQKPEWLQMGEWDVLGNEPGREIVFFTGEWAFNFLLLTLVASTFRRQLSFSSLIPQRRKLGLFCFFYAMLHGLAFAGFLLEWQWQEIVEELIERQYLTFGMLALVILIPLALTSTKGWQKRLGQRWKSLHKAVYLIAILVAIHYLLKIR